MWTGVRVCMQCVCVCVLEVDLCAFSINLSILWITTLCKQTRYKIVVIWGGGGGEVYELALESWGWGGWVHIDTACYWKGEACLDVEKN